MEKINGSFECVFTYFVRDGREREGKSLRFF
jgi:hypothetical protein